MLKVIRKKHEINRNQICCIFYRKIADIIFVCVACKKKETKRSEVNHTNRS